jgi:hypothetical protein
MVLAHIREGYGSTQYCDLPVKGMDQHSIGSYPQVAWLCIALALIRERHGFK